jgi:hypothetical protein
MKQRFTQKFLQVTIPIFSYFFPPKAYYRIDASINLEKGLIKGKGSINWVNDTSESLEIVALDWHPQIFTDSQPIHGWDI